MAQPHEGEAIKAVLKIRILCARPSCFWLRKSFGSKSGGAGDAEASNQFSEFCDYFVVSVMP